jgi:geranylgeranyl diphosphate synthase type II
LDDRKNGVKKEYLKLIEEGLRVPQTPESLYAPIEYFLSLPAKRIRPLLTLAVYEALTGRWPEPALAAALAVETFHNFTLVHDDVMDHAELRRGMPTVHQRYGLNAAILSGDAMHVLAFRFLAHYDEPLRGRLTFFLLETAREVCEGQAKDLDGPSDVASYLDMLEQKTGALLGAAAAFGAMVAGADVPTVQKINACWRNWGTGFQIIDDVLDMYGGQAFGKQPGGDVLEGKKTALWYAAYESPAYRAALDDAWPRRDVQEMRALFDRTDAADIARRRADERFERARQLVADLPALLPVFQWLDSLAQRTT